MRKVRSTDTLPEQILGNALRAKGLHFTTCRSDLAGKPDIVVPARRLAIFVDGDFWHGGQWKKRNLSALDEQFHRTRSKNYWVEKIRGNCERDCRATAALLDDGWVVLRFWESSIRHNLEECVTLAMKVATEGADIDSHSVLAQKTVAEFFAGIGLMRSGLEREGWTVKFANDIDSKKYEMYKAHFTDADQHFFIGDIHQLSAEKVPTTTLATASFPCNDLSLAGSRNGLHGNQSSAFWGFVRILQDMKSRRPPLVLVENVTGFLTSARGIDFGDALVALNRLGYAVDTFILDAANFVPQSRQRLFIVGVQRTDEQSPTVSPFLVSEMRPRALVEFMTAHTEIKWNIRNLPNPPQTKTKLAEILENLPDCAPEWWDKARAKYLLNQMSPRHRKVAEHLITGKRWSYGTVFRRIRKKKSMAELRTDGIAGCLRTPRGGSGRQILLKAGKGKYFARLLTPRECARLMGADEFIISGSLNQALFGFGDAVCVPVVEWIAKHYLNPLVSELIRDRALIPTSLAARA